MRIRNPGFIAPSQKFAGSWIFLIAVRYLYGEVPYGTGTYPTYVWTCFLIYRVDCAVTETDQAVEKMLQSGLHEKYPNYQ